jgi:D-alanyl-D-alanine carboxypeptidase
MWTPTRLNDGTMSNYGFGWNSSDAARRQIYCTGNKPGFSSLIRRYLNDRLTVILVSNADTADTRGITFKVAALYLPAPNSAQDKKQR